MSEQPPKYVSLLRLARDWAVQGGEPVEFVIRQICSWAMFDAFPAGSFIYATGDEIEPMDLYMSFQVAINGKTSPNQRWNREVLERALVSKQGISAFCDRTETAPPPFVDRVSSRLKRVFSPSRYASPPFCPNVEERVAQLNAREWALGTMNTMKSMLQTAAQGKPDLDGYNRSNASPPHRSNSSSRWLRYTKMAQSFIEGIGDTKLQSELNELNSEWEKIDRDSGSDKRDIQVPDHETAAIGTRVATGPNKRARGRPPGSGSYSKADLPLIRKMNIEILNSGSSISSVANKFASEAVGGGTDESKAKRLSDRYIQIYPQT
jgi:hypothetical protein